MYQNTFCTVLVVLLSSSCFGETITWSPHTTASSSNTWHHPPNWDLGRYPDSGDSVVIPTVAMYNVVYIKKPVIEIVSLSIAAGMTLVVQNVLQVDERIDMETAANIRLASHRDAKIEIRAGLKWKDHVLMEPVPAFDVGDVVGGTKELKITMMVNTDDDMQVSQYDRNKPLLWNGVAGESWFVQDSWSPARKPTNHDWIDIGATNFTQRAHEVEIISGMGAAHCYGAIFGGVRIHETVIVHTWLGVGNGGTKINLNFKLFISNFESSGFESTGGLEANNSVQFIVEVDEHEQVHYVLVSESIKCERDEATHTERCKETCMEEAPFKRCGTGNNINIVYKKAVTCAQYGCAAGEVCDEDKKKCVLGDPGETPNNCMVGKSAMAMCNALCHDEFVKCDEMNPNMRLFQPYTCQYDSESCEAKRPCAKLQKGDEEMLYGLACAEGFVCDASSKSCVEQVSTSTMPHNTTTSQIMDFTPDYRHVRAPDKPDWWWLLVLALLLVLLSLLSCCYFLFRRRNKWRRNVMYIGDEDGHLRRRDNVSAMNGVVMVEERKMMEEHEHKVALSENSESSGSELGLMDGMATTKRRGVEESDEEIEMPSQLETMECRRPHNAGEETVKRKRPSTNTNLETTQLQRPRKKKQAQRRHQ